ncbi:MAG: flavin reductase family protein [Acidimicrobiia bacterium]
MTIHNEHPFLPPPESRDRARQLRGRLAGPVTIVTAGNDGMTASAVLVLEGSPARVVVAINESSEFCEAVKTTERFVVHVAQQDHRRLSDRFAELSPSPGGLFAGLELTETEWGPLIVGFDNWAGCRLEAIYPVGWQMLLVAEIEHLQVSELDDPLLYFRGRYRSLA